MTAANQIVRPRHSPQAGLLTLCFQHLERCRDQRFSKPNQRARLA